MEAMSEIIPVGGQLTVSAVLGFAVGYALKKLAKVALVLIGAQMAFLELLNRKGVITEIRWEKLYGDNANSFTELSSKMLQDTNAVLMDFVGTMAIGGGFSAGALIGFKRG